MQPPKEEIAPGDDVFTEDDLAPSDEERQARRRAIVDRVATAVACVCLGLWAGGMLSLGACAAPFVFRLTPAPLNANAMGAAFARFDGIAMTCAIVALGAEVVRTILALKRADRSWWPRLRRYAAIILAASAVYQGVRLTPGINRLHEEGTRRRVGAAGAELESLHNQAESLGKLVVPLALALMVLHIATLRGVRDEEEDALTRAPAPPGPGS